VPAMSGGGWPKLLDCAKGSGGGGAVFGRRNGATMRNAGSLAGSTLATGGAAGDGF
jgi:hypothetical protein